MNNHVMEKVLFQFGDVSLLLPLKNFSLFNLHKNDKQRIFYSWYQIGGCNWLLDIKLNP